MTGAVLTGEMRARGGVKAHTECITNLNKTPEDVVFQCNIKYQGLNEQPITTAQKNKLHHHGVDVI